MSVLLLGAMLCFAKLASAEGPNPLHHYLNEGAPVSSWHLSLGDESEWYQPQKELKGISKNKAIEFSQHDGALHLKWRSKKKEGVAALNGSPIDLSQLDDTIGIAFEMKVSTKRLKTPIKLSMDCGYPCRGTANLQPILDVFPRDEWFTLPLPLRCFKNAGTDFSKLTSPFNLQTKGRLEIAIRDVRLRKIPADLPFCK
ncbi:MAG TPA: putative glycoside hydrolase [Marinagarivorans sp.]